MAEDDNDVENTEEKPSGGGKKKLIIMVVVALLLVGLSVGGTLLALDLLVEKPAVTNEEGEVVEEEVVEEKKTAIYYPLKPEILASYNVRGRQRYVQADMTLMLRDESVIEVIELHKPMIRNSLVLLFGGQVYEELQTAEGKEYLRQQALETIQGLLEQEIGEPGIEQVLFTNFVMQ